MGVGVGEQEDKIYVCRDNTATFICRSCGRTRTEEAARFNNIHGIVRVKVNCPCGHSNSVFIERRKHIRKSMDLGGSFTRLRDNTGGWLTVKELSMFSIRIRAGKICEKLEVGEMLHIAFRLKDHNYSMISRTVTVNRVGRRHVVLGYDLAEYQDPLSAYLFYSS